MTNLEPVWSSFEPFLSFVEGYRPNCDLICCQNPIPSSYYATMNLRQYFLLFLNFQRSQDHLEDQFGHFWALFHISEGILTKLWYQRLSKLNPTDLSCCDGPSAIFWCGFWIAGDHLGALQESFRGPIWSFFEPFFIFLKGYRRICVLVFVWCVGAG